CEAEGKAERGRGTSAGNSAVTGSRSVNVIFTKNEPVVGRNIFHRARPWQGAKLTPWLWAGGTKEVRTSTEMCRDPGRHGRCAAIDGRGYTRPCKTENRDVLFRIPQNIYFRTRYRKMLMIESHSSEIET